MGEQGEHQHLHNRGAGASSVALTVFSVSLAKLSQFAGGDVPGTHHEKHQHVYRR